MFGTDLGFSFPFDDRLYFLFGETVGVHSGDCIAYSQDTDPEDCLKLRFVTGSDGRYLPPKVPGVNLGAFEVPMGGLAAGGKMYVFFTTDHTAEKVMGRSVLARTDDGAKTFTLLEYVSTDKFINVDPVVMDDAAIKGLPESTGQGILLWGTGDYRMTGLRPVFIARESQRLAVLYQERSGHRPAALE